MPPLLTWLLLIVGGYALVYGVLHADRRLDEFADARRRERALRTMGDWFDDEDQDAIA